ncbi:cytochrome b5 [Martensiomyces pterosporus]|nr:cytochrome b5 [Martensiomyces pterosporus]
MSQTFTLKTLKEYSGQDESKPILLALNGKVYDVTTGRGFYGPGGSYSVFAGRDCTRGLAIGSLKPEDLPTEDDVFVTQETLDESLWQSMLSWENRLKAKYPVVGTLVPN